MKIAGLFEKDSLAIYCIVAGRGFEPLIFGL